MSFFRLVINKTERAACASVVLFLLTACNAGSGGVSNSASAAVTVNAGTAQTLHGGVAVSLSGSATTSVSGATITGYSWTQTAGPAVTLAGATTPAPTFTAPTVTSQTTLTFRLTATSSTGATGTATVNVNVQSQHNVVLTWSANHETAVNKSGGGYLITVAGTPYSVPYVSGALAPTTVTVQLWSGSYNATIQAYSSLNPPGSSSGSTSALSSPISINVP